jgi:hypothetical protein
MLKNNNRISDPCIWSFHYYKLKIPVCKIQNTLCIGKINIYKFHDSKFVIVKILNTENRTFLKCFSASRDVYRRF